MQTDFVLLARVGDPNQAMLLRARLDSEGIAARVRSEAFGPYRLSIGAMAVTEIWIPLDRMEEACLILLAADVDAIVADVEPLGAGPSSHRVRSWIWWLVAALLIILFAYAGVAAIRF